MRLNHKQIATYTGGSFVVSPIDAAELMRGVTWDSREVEPGWLYVALPGERTDGHVFVASALRAGARAALVSEMPDAATCALARELGASVIEVPNTAAAITDLARAWRGHLKGRVIGLTGSTGKTTTKNLVRDVAAAGLSVVATKANQNNELGVPRTLLAADPDTQVVVVEMGMRGLGQIAALCDFVRPDWGLITNVGESHIELLGSRENIARAKAELIAALPKGSGVAFLNAADDMADFVWDTSGLRAWGNERVSFNGAGAAAQPCVWAEGVELDDEGRPRFTLCARGFAPVPTNASASTPLAVADTDADGAAVERAACHLSLRGMHNVHNACAAAAVGRRLGLSLDVVARALERSVPESGRQEVITARGGFTIVNDAYNANPDSMRASLSTFCALSVRGRRVAVLGDMGELGDFARACHEGIGRMAATLPLDMLICVGELSEHIAAAAEEAGMDESRVVRARTVADVLEVLDAYLEKDDAVLVKASHFMGLTRVVEGLVS
ncbi:MAG: UDP-N-acetylmuramoyl-tripeptide--D-alanyl-D-alanine ligase [Eggerthellaceae bacterium]|nr:UDP-N-acetylmuramoyl-tripeptide--D-alanyl-D-alanine ligase [Eggerthellaceae bacterium]